jgi:hypothetical protein
MIFVSFMFRDITLATELISRLEGASVPCVHANLEKIPENSLCATIEQYLLLSTHSIVVANATSAPSPWVAFEAGFALALRHPLFTFGSQSDTLPPFLSQWPSIPDWEELDLFVNVYKSGRLQLDEQDSKTLSAVDLQGALQFQTFKTATCTDWLRERYHRVRLPINQIR